MEKETTTSTTKPLGMCEKLFNAFHSNTTFRPLRRLTFRNQDPATTTTTDDDNNNNNNNNNNINNHIEKNQGYQTLPTPTKPSPPLPEKVAPAKAKVDVKVEGKPPEKPQVVPPPTTIPTITVTTTRKVPEKVLPIPAPPKTVAVTPLPPAEAVKPKKNINQKAEDYITRAKGKISWSSSGVGKTPQSQ